MTVSNYSATQLLDLVPGIGQRSDLFVFELLTAQHDHLGYLDVNGGDTSPQVQMDTTRSSFWTLSNVTLYGSDVSEIDVRKDRIRVLMVLEDGTPLPVGVYGFGENPKTRDVARTWTPQLFDETFYIAQPLARSYGTPKGGSLIDLYIRMITPLNLPVVTINCADNKAGSPVLFKPGDDLLESLKTIAFLLGAFPPHMNAFGEFELIEAPSPGTDQGADHIYNSGGRVIADKSVLTDDLYQMPNRWIAVGDDPAFPIVGVYNLPDESPASAAQRGGRIVAKSFNLQGLSNTKAAEKAARRAALTDPTIYEKAQFSSTADPRHGVFDTVMLYGLRYLEVGWQLDCRSGGEHVHSLVRLYD